jgi:acyl carrier protein/predicted esterase
VYSPPLLSGTWFEPPGPTGVHRIGIETLMESLREVPSGVEVVICKPVTQLKHWKMVLGGSSTSAGKSAVELRTFLRTEVASILGVHAGTIAEDRGLDSLGVDSLATLRLSQRLRKFLDRNISAFALQNNPTITSLVETLTHGEAAVAGSVRGTVICFHGFKTSGNILEQQMRLLTVVLHGMGFKVVFPNGPHRTSGAAQFAAGLDEDDAYAWYTYSDEALLGTSAIGLDATLALVESLGDEFAGVVGFSQGGGIAAQFAKQVGAKFAVLFSPVHVPGQSAWCTCPTLVLRDPNDTVAADTTTLIAELPADSTEVLDHSEGHRFPTAPPLYANIASFVSAAMSQ